MGEFGQGTKGYKWANRTVNREDVIPDLAKRVGLTQHQARLALEALVDILQESLLQGFRVELRNFGVFNPRIKQRSGEERTWVNPKTLQVHKFKVTGGTVHFKPATNFVRALVGLEPKTFSRRKPKKLDDLILGLIKAEQ